MVYLLFWILTFLVITGDLILFFLLLERNTMGAFIYLFSVFCPMILIFILFKIREKQNRITRTDWSSNARP